MTGAWLLLFLLLASPARAQDADPEAPLDSIPVVESEPVVVTILRDRVALAEAPLAVTVVERGPVARLRPSLALDDALAGVPGIQVDDRHNEALGERISIRGFGARAQFGVRGLRVIVDGVPATMPDGQTALSHVDPATIRRAEVVRGSGSAVWGNASGGVILLETVEPPGSTLLAVGATAGSFGLRRVSGEAGGGGGRLAWRAHVTGVGSDGHRRFSDADHVFAGAKLRHAGDRVETQATLAFVDYEAKNPGSLTDSLAAADPEAAFPLNVGQRTGERARQAQGGLALRWRRGGSELELGGWGLLREVDNPIPPAIVDLYRTAGGVRAVWRTATAPDLSGPRLIAGLDLDLLGDDRRNFENLEGDQGALLLDQRERVRALGPFVQAALPLGDRAALRAALRYDRVRFAVDDHFVEGDPDDSGRRTMTALSPSLGATLEPAPGLTLYGRVATGFDTPTTSELANRPDGAGGLNPDLEPQRSRTVEAGARASRGRWSGEAALYRTRVEDALVPFQVPGVPGRDFFRNAGSAIHRGLEVVLRLAPRAGSTIGLAYASVEARFDRFRTEDAVLDGRRVPGVAPHRLALNLEQTARGWRLDLRTRHVARLPVDDANTRHADGYWIADLHLAHDGFAVGRARIAPFLGVTNLLDTTYTGSVTVNAVGGRFFEPGPPRAAYGGLQVARLGG